MKSKSALIVEHLAQGSDVMDESERGAELLKLSEVSAQSGISLDVLRRMVSDDLLPHAQRGRAGHIYFPADAVPTWAQELVKMSV